ncbi:PrsW family intramembrane metalloprotease [Cohnella endophytica]|uniref:PrsW family intramembrane metalloprotease n=1 Tax=Cohnella endophytica TaxID=2419778 RepID=A0A494XAU7_9BACL|nr:cyclic nucleotide-binding domain-containing protein [Cohnella endophytica]RKP46761.1 PrsW family intramembrane metalloprotease [Cohnella endophytica]
MPFNAIIDYLRDHPLLQGIPDDELEHAASSIELVDFKDAQPLIIEGAPSKDCFFLWTGKVQVSSRNLVGKTMLLAELGPGALVGEMGLIRNERRSARVTAIGDVTALRLERQAFERLAESSPLFHESLMLNVRIRMIHGMLRKASIWSAIPDAELRGLAEITLIRKVAKGEEIIAEGSLVDQFFMVSKGRLELREEKKRKTVLRDGDFFGERELLTDLPSTSTLIASEDSELLVMGKSEFLCILSYYAPVRLQFIEVLRIRAPQLISQVTIGTEKEEPQLDKKNSPLPEAKDKWIDLLLWLGGGFLAFSMLALFLHNSWWNIAALIVGGIVGPVTFVAYVRSQQLLGFRQTRLGMVFVATAAIAVPLAWILERMWLFNVKAETFDFTQLSVPLSVAVIEETVKLLVCVALVRTKQMHFLMDAVVFGAAAGMGFAAVESVIYGWTHLGQASSLGMLSVLWMRALLSPFGHGTWTAIAAAGIWYGTRSRELIIGKNTKAWARWRHTISLLTLAIGLHMLWDYRFTNGFMKMGMMIAVGCVGLYLLYILIRTGRREEYHALTVLNPYMQEELKHDDQGTTASKELQCEACGTMSPHDTRYCARCGQALRMK